MQKKFVMYMVGRSGSGKTTIAKALVKKMKQGSGKRFQLIDGDVIRRQFGDIFGYTREERMKCNRAVRVVVQYLIDNDIPVVLAQVAPYEEMRELVRQQFDDKYLEVYIKCSYEECVRRDVKGYYRKQKQGQMEHLSGADDVYEEPRNSDIVIDTEQESIEDAVKKIIAYLEAEGYGI